MRRLILALLFMCSYIYADDDFSLLDQSESVLVKTGGTEFRIMKNPVPEWKQNAVVYAGNPGDNAGLCFYMSSPYGTNNGKAGSLQLLTGKSSSCSIVLNSDDAKIVQVEYLLYAQGGGDSPYPNGKLVLVANFRRGVPAVLLDARPVAVKNDFSLNLFTASFGGNFEEVRAGTNSVEPYGAASWQSFPQSEYLVLSKGGRSYLAASSGGKTRTPSAGVAFTTDINQYRSAILHRGESAEFKMLIGNAGNPRDLDAGLAFYRTSRQAAKASASAMHSENMVLPYEFTQAPSLDASFSEWTSTPLVRGAGYERPRDSFTWKGDNDLSIKTWTAFDKDNFYIACRVNDDCFDQKNSDGSIWAGDMLQISFDPLLEKAVTDNFIDIGFTASDNPVAWCWQHPDKKYIGDISKVVRFKTSRDSLGANYEIAIPWDFLKPFDLRRGKFGFSLAALDSDNHGIENWIGLTEGVAGGKSPDLYPEVHIGSSEDILAATYGYSKPSLFFNSEFLLADEPNAFSAAVLIKKNELPAELCIDFSSGASRKTFKQELSAGFNSFNLTLPTHCLNAGDCSASVYILKDGAKKYEKKTTVSIIDSDSILKNLDAAQAKYDKLSKLVKDIQSGRRNVPYLVSALGIAEYFIPFVYKEVTSKSIYREKQLRSGKGREDVPLDAAYKLFVYPRAKRNIAYINSMLDESLAQAERILSGAEAPLTVPVHPKGIKPSISKGSFWIGPDPALFLGPNTWQIHYTQIPGVARSGFNFIDMNQLLGNEIVYKDEPFTVPRHILSPNGNALREAEKNGVYFFGREWEGNNRLTAERFAAFENRLATNSDATKSLDKEANLVYFVTQNETFIKEKDAAVADLAFRKYLEGKYKNVSALNKVLASSFKSFDDIKLKDVPSSGALKYEFFLFESRYQLDMLGRFNSLRHKYLKSPFSTHFSTLNFYAYDPLMGAADYEKIWAEFDVIGWDGGIGPDDRHYSMRWSNDEILHCDLARSFYPDKPIANNEAHNIPGKYGSEVSSEFMYSAIFQPYLHGRNAAVLWVWDLDGHNPWGNHLFTRANTHHAAAKAALDLRRLAAYVVPFQKLAGPVAILYSLPSMADSSYIKDMVSVYEGIFFAGFPVKFISERQIAAGKLADYKVLLVPDARRVSAVTFKSVSAFAANGGKVVLVGDESLRCDEYGKPVPSRDAARKSMIHIPLATPEKYFSEFCNIVDSLKLRPDVEVRSPDGKRIWALEYRSAKMPDGTQLVYLLNLGKETCKAKVMADGKLFDLIRDREMSDVLDVKPLEIYLLKVLKNK